jgi:hypothetical protein
MLTLVAGPSWKYDVPVSAQATERRGEERRGSLSRLRIAPYTLVLTKTTQLFAREEQQRNRDQAD